MLNNLTIEAALPQETAYENVDSIVLLLCRECVPALGRLKLPGRVAELAAAYLDKYSAEAFTIGSVRTAVVPLAGRLLNLLFVGCGTGSECKPNAFRKAAGEAARQLAALAARKAAVAAPILLQAERGHYLAAIVEGFYLGAYTFTSYKSDAPQRPLSELVILSEVKEAETIVKNAGVAAQAVSSARDLVNQPGNALTPADLAALTVAAAAEDAQLTAAVLNTAALTEQKMQALLAVGQGSKNPPCLAVLKYQGAGAAPFTALVGKGITFDSGGISLKPDDKMGEMKDDMTGAAVVLETVKAASRLRLPVNLYAVLACAENMPGGAAQRPGDIVRAANGKTIEVISTDAEGRMVLADAVYYACSLGAARVIDIATLTGAVLVALGKECSAIIANDDSLAAEIKEAGHLAGENWWQLPALPECRQALKSEAADLVNSVGRAAGCITGGLFIGEFITAGVAWAHLDIGGTATAEKSSGFTVQGGTAFGVLTLLKLAARWARKE